MVNTNLPQTAAAPNGALMSKNITHEVTALFAPASISPCFQVQATSEIITTRGRRIAPGDVIVIDPLQSPDDDQMVLVGESVLPFIGQNHGGIVAGFLSATI